MNRLPILGRFGLLLCAGLWLIPAIAQAQNTGIAGVVKDPSGGVIPGVTVEAESPALIEKVRSVVTNAQGLYSIVDLRPGTYVVTFSLPGFATVKHEGIELVASFTATVNAELKVGGVEETLTVTGEAPSVDIHNIVQQRVLSDELRDALPNGRSVVFMALTIPGITNTSTVRGTAQDVVGASDSRGSSMIHGSRTSDYRTEMDGVKLNTTSTQSNPGEVQEYVYEVGAISAESADGGVRANIIPKEGGNRYTGDFFYAFTNKDLVANNLTQKLIDLGIPKPNTILYSRDANFSVGGPIAHDRLWFFGSYRFFGQNEQVPGMYFAIDPYSFVFNPSLGAAGNADLNRPAFNKAGNWWYNGRATWQATPKNKLSFYLSEQPRYTDGTFVTGTRSMEAGNYQTWSPNWIGQLSWKLPMTSRLLLETNVTSSGMHGVRTDGYKGEVIPNIVSVTDTGTGYTYRASPEYDQAHWQTDVFKTALSYVTGSHSAKVGLVVERGWNKRYNVQRAQFVTYTFKNGVPTSISVSNDPYFNLPEFHRLGAYAQDQWTLKRLTVNAGLRLDINRECICEVETTGPNAYEPLQQWPVVKNIPNWKDVDPRLGLAFDLFGNGKTAIKGTLSRYVVNDDQAFAASVNPVAFNLTATRPWTDTVACAGGIPNDFTPQPCELGTLSNSAFGTTATTTHVDDKVRQGWGVRPANWEVSAGIQHQLFPQLALSASFTRRWFTNFTVTDNLALVPADYDEFCITAPTDDRLGSVSGSRICGLYDLNPAKRTVTPNNLVTAASNYGKQTERYQGVDLIANARLPGRITLTGGLNSGTDGNNTNNCFVVDSPQQRFCDVKRPWRTNVRLISSVELPWGINTGVSFQTIAGVPILANYSVTNADITSGKVQFVNPARTTFSGASSTVSLLAPGSMFNERLYQVDVRLAKTIRHGRLHGRLMVDIGNLFNASTILVQNNTYGTSWLRPANTLTGRVIKPGVQLEF